MAVWCRNALIRVPHYDADSAKHELVQGYWEAIPGWSWSGFHAMTYVPADVVGKEERLKQWSAYPLVSAPWVCQLCEDAGFVSKRRLRGIV